MGAMQRGLAEILSDDLKDATDRSPANVLSSIPAGNQDEAERLREQVLLFEDQVRKLIGRINWLQDNLQHEEESRVDAEKQAESLRAACSEQAERVEELSEQMAILFRDLDEQQKNWSTLEAKLEFEQRERMFIEATLKALANGMFPPMTDSSPISPHSTVSSPVFHVNNVDLSDSWTVSSPEVHSAVSWSMDSDGKTSKADNMFKELNSEWSHYKSEGKLGSWSLAKVLRRLSFSDTKKKNHSSGLESLDDACELARFDDSSPGYDTAKLTEEIFSLDSEASDVRQRHLVDLRKKLEVEQQQSAGAETEDRESCKESSTAPSKSRGLKASKVPKAVSKLSGKKSASQKSADADQKVHFKLENLGRQVFQLKKLCTEKTQLVKLEKKRRSEVENRYYVLVKNLDKQLLQLRKIHLRKSDEVKQEKSRRQELEKKSCAELESLERQVTRLTKLAESRAHELKVEQKQKSEAQRKLKDLVSQLKTAKAGQGKLEKSLKMKQASASKIQAQTLVSPHEVEGTDEGDIVELESLQFRKVAGSSECPELASDRQLWKIQSKQKGRFVLTQVEQALLKAEQNPESSSSRDHAAESSGVANPCMEPATSRFCGAVEGKISSELEAAPELAAAAAVGSSLADRMLQLKQTTNRLLQDLQGTQRLLSHDEAAAGHGGEECDHHHLHLEHVHDSQGMLWGFEQAGVESRGETEKSRSLEVECGNEDGLRGDFSGAAIEYRKLLVLPVEEGGSGERPGRQSLGWMMDMKRQLEFVEKLVIRLGGLVFDKAEKLQEAITETRETLGSKVEDLKLDVNRVANRRGCVDSQLTGASVTSPAVKQERFSAPICRYDGLIGLRFVCQLDTSTTTTTQVLPVPNSITPEPEFF